MAQGPSSQEKTRVAVVAVHGVGKHEAGASARAMADLLLGLGSENDRTTGPYVDFEEEGIQVALPSPDRFRQGVATGKGGLWTRLRTIFEERRGFFRDAYRIGNWRKRHQPDIGILANEFMATQLSDYEGDQTESTYDTLRLVSRRPKEQANKPDVHIYEMHWSDLTRPSNSFVRFLLSLYQLLLHLSSLGRTAIDHAALEHVGKPEWLLLQRSYSYAVRVLTLVIVNLFVLLPVIVFSPFALKLKGWAADSVAATVIGVVLLGIAVWLTQVGNWFSSRFWFPYLAVAAGLAAWICYSVLQTPHVDRILMAEWWVIGFAVAAYVFKKYDEVRNGALQSGVILMALAAAGFVCCVYASASKEPLREAAFQMIFYAFLVLQASWLLLAILSCFAGLMELICVRRAGSPEKRARARAACRTGRFALALPTVLFILLSVFSWSVVWVFATSNNLRLYTSANISPPRIEGPIRLIALDRDEGCKMVGREPAGPKDSPACNKDNDAFLRYLIVQSSPPGMPEVLALLSTGFLLLVLLAICSVYFEVKPQIQGRDSSSRELGAWLNGGLQSFWIPITCFWMAAFGWPVAFTLAAWQSYHFGLDGFVFHLFTWHDTGQITNIILFGAAGAIVASIAILSLIFKGASKVLDIILDVDNYLRTSPAENTPRARIIERYVALLHFLAGAGYDKIIVVAHSLGSNISADLLRFLHSNTIPELSKYARPNESSPSIQLMTMGSPLRQLLNRFFPHLYLWIRPIPDDARVKAPLVDPLKGYQNDYAIIPNNATPSARELGVASWTNAYRSGDYVGRSIWLDGWYQHARNAVAPGPDEFHDKDETRFEFCIGIGAHTHYWDRTAPQIAERLEALICEAKAARATA